MQGIGKQQVGRGRGVALMFCAPLLWSIGGMLVKGIGWHPLLIAGGRSAIAAVVIGLFMWWRGYRLKINRYSLLSALGCCGCYIFYCFANKWTTAANAIVLEYTGPAFVLVYSALFLHKKLKPRDVAIVIITLACISLFFFDQLSPGNMLGNLMGILAGASNAVMFTTMGQVPDDDDTRMTGMLLANILAGLIGGVTLFFLPITLDAHSMVFILLLGVVQMGVSYIIYSIAAAYCSAVACSLIAMLEAVLNPLWVMMAYGERPGLFALIGGVALIVSIASYLIFDSKATATDEKRKEKKGPAGIR